MAIPRSNPKPSPPAFRRAGRGGSRGTAVVALNGSSRAELRAALAIARGFDRAPFRIAVDGGLDAFRGIRERPDLLVGDLDSTPGVPRRLEATIYPRDKDFSDLAGALRETERRGLDVVVVAGLAGGRLDHEWSNLLELGAAAPALAGIVAPTSRGLVVVTARAARLVTEPGRLVSLFALARFALVTLRGTRWTLERRRVAPGSAGLSNVTGRRLDLTVHDGVVALVFPELP